MSQPYEGVDPGEHPGAWEDMEFVIEDAREIPVYVDLEALSPGA